VKDRLLAKLRAAPKGLTKTDIRDEFSHRSTAQVDEALAELRDAGTARMEKVSTGGRPSEVWFATEATKATKAPREALSSLRSLSSHADERLVSRFLDALRDGALPPDADVSKFDELTRQAWAEAVGRYAADEGVAR
jgi:hypothetical protein